ncbi:MAG: hypothetical protein Q7J06_04790 [Bacteroidales bacterium]|nr:hypothetical protein [Bacteroidales bacterium]
MTHFIKKSEFTAGLVLALIVGLAVAGFLPISAQAQDPVIHLVLGGEGATSWNVANIEPGESGTKTVTLHNAGYWDGRVTIWISDIVSSEGINPESEAGDTTQPSELGGYLLLNISCSRLSTDISLPTTIDKLPQDASAWPSYLRVSPVNVGDTVTLYWQWELPIETGNNVQGDSLSFAINYMLEEFPPEPEEVAPSPPPPPPTGTTPVSDIVTTDGIFTEEVLAESFDKVCHLTIDKGTKGLTKEKEPLSQISMVEMGKPPALPEDVSTIGLIYDFGPDGATFDPPITLTISYDPSLMPEGIAKENLVIAYYDKESEKWIELDSVVDTKAKTISAKVSHLTVFALLGKVPPPPPPAPAEFAVSGLVVSPGEVYVGESVSIRVLVANTGGESGSCNVTLKINGTVEEVKEVTVSASLSKEVTFSMARDTVDIYSVDVNGLVGSFTVRGKPITVPAPAAFAVSDLVISPREVYVGEPVAIEVLVANTGGESGSYEVSFKISGIVKEAKELTLSPGSSQKVGLTMSRDVPGTYEVDVNGLIGSFTVKKTPDLGPPPGFNWQLTGGIIAAVVIVGLFIYYLVRRRRKV